MTIDYSQNILKAREGLIVFFYRLSTFYELFNVETYTGL